MHDTAKLWVAGRLILEVSGGVRRRHVVDDADDVIVELGRLGIVLRGLHEALRGSLQELVSSGLAIRVVLVDGVLVDVLLADVRGVPRSAMVLGASRRVASRSVRTSRRVDGPGRVSVPRGRPSRQPLIHVLLEGLLLDVVRRRRQVKLMVMEALPPVFVVRLRVLVQLFPSLVI